MQSLNQGDVVSVVQPIQKAMHPFIDDALGLTHGGLAVVFGVLHDMAQVVNAVEVDVFQALNLRLNVSGDGQVKHEHGAVFALFER